VQYLYILDKRPGKFDSARLATPGSLLADLSFLSLLRDIPRTCCGHVSCYRLRDESNGQDRTAEASLGALFQGISLSRIFSSALLVKTNTYAYTCKARDLVVYMLDGPRDASIDEREFRRASRLTSRSPRMMKRESRKLRSNRINRNRRNVNAPRDLIDSSIETRLFSL
jgi:hypothetical protein